MCQFPFDERIRISPTRKRDDSYVDGTKWRRVEFACRIDSTWSPSPNHRNRSERKWYNRDFASAFGELFVLYMTDMTGITNYRVTMYRDWCWSGFFFFKALHESGCGFSSATIRAALSAGGMCPSNAFTQFSMLLQNITRLVQISTSLNHIFWLILFFFFFLPSLYKFLLGAPIRYTRSVQNTRRICGLNLIIRS